MTMYTGVDSRRVGTYLNRKCLISDIQIKSN